jgi:archaemetzincin
VRRPTLVATLCAVALLGASAVGPSAIGPMAIGRAQEAAPDARVRAQVRLVVLESFPRAWIDPIVRDLESHLGVQAIVDERHFDLPRFAYYPPRRRYRAERLLRFLTASFEGSPSNVRILGLTARDISTTKEPYEDWGILGLADLGGPAAVVSSFRMRRRARDPEQALFRMTTTAVHETGHALGLPHCTESRCLMRDAEGTMDTVDRGDGELGPSCRSLLERVAPRTVARQP